MLTSVPKKITLPENLSVCNGYYRYLHPKTGRYHGVGTSLADAIQIAEQLNQQLMPSKQESIQERIDKILNAENREFRNFSEFLNYFAENILPQRNIAQKTMQDYQARLVHLHGALGRYQTNKITIGHIAKFLAPYPPQQSNHYRAFLHLIFRYAIAEGVCEHNPAQATIPKSISIQRRALTEAQFWLIHARAPRFLQNAMELGLYTLLRRYDLCELKFENIQDDFLLVKTHKTGAALKIQITPPIEQVLTRCKDRIASPYVLHIDYHRYYYRNKAQANQILPDYLTKAFSKARDTTGLFTKLDARQRPTLHEVRGLGAFLYEKSGVSRATIQALLGHANSVMTEYYLSKHQERYTEIILG